MIPPMLLLPCVLKYPEVTNKLSTIIPKVVPRTWVDFQELMLALNPEGSFNHSQTLAQQVGVPPDLFKSNPLPSMQDLEGSFLRKRQ